tara:strand:+ start:10096 stop:11340 length:1245 start_codon:yes stop_codon:yes gene_type:complete
MSSIGVIGLGYVGLPLALALATKYKVFGYDINPERLKNLRLGIDDTKAVSSNEFKNVEIEFVETPNLLKSCDIYIITVPTPLKKNHLPDFSFLEQATMTVSNILNRGDIVIYESTVYPGATEEICIPILEKSLLVFNRDFYVGYSPERINIGDSRNTFKNISKIVSASNKSTLQTIFNLYQSVLDAKVYKAPSIKVAEAAKVIENTQRDVNIAFVNELAMMFSKMKIDTNEVLKAASTKWNFLDFKPGLVGGHCIGIDPYYLLHRSKAKGFNPILMHSARKVNEGLPIYIAKEISKKINLHKIDTSKAKVLLLGITFKENVSDIRNSKAIELAKHLRNSGLEIVIYDPNVKGNLKTLKMKKISEFPTKGKFDIIIFALKHKQFLNISPIKFLKKNGFVYDVKGFLYRHKRIYRL